MVGVDRAATAASSSGERATQLAVCVTNSAVGKCACRVRIMPTSGMMRADDAGCVEKWMWQVARYIAYHCGAAQCCSLFVSVLGKKGRR